MCADAHAFSQALRIGGSRRPKGAGRALNESGWLAAIKLLRTPPVYKSSPTSVNCSDPGAPYLLREHGGRTLHE
jgi:hypothetical protein